MTNPGALELAVRYYNKCLELEEIIEMFCMDADWHRRASEACNKQLGANETISRYFPLEKLHD